MNNKGIRSLVVVGGGTAGWMSATYMASKFFGTGVQVSLVESSRVDPIGVGEATVPAIKYFLSEVGINEKEFIRATNATFKLGIEFEGWKEKGHRFFHPFGALGSRIGSVDFIHYWTRGQAAGCCQSLDSYSLSAQMARAGKFAVPRGDVEVDEAVRFNYAYHFDATLFAKYLRLISEKMGVRYIDGTIKKAQRDDSGDLSSLLLEDGSEIQGDFFIDCSGFSGILINAIDPDAEYDDWSYYLPCDRAVVAQSSSTSELESCTRSIAMSAGWRWAIPLQNRVGNGYVYSSSYITDEEASNELLESLGEGVLTAPRIIRFTPRQRKRVWVKNVFSVGLSSGFLEPLESTNLYLVQYSLTALFKNFPSGTARDYLQVKVNDMVERQVVNMRDFLIAHYCNNDRKGEPFWDYCRNIDLPESLSDRLEEFNKTGTISVGSNDFFRESSWMSLLSGMGSVPEHYHPKVDFFSDEVVCNELGSMKEAIDNVVSGLSTHRIFLNNNGLCVDL